jgi:hypothetical protein
VIAASVEAGRMPSHLGQDISRQVTLELVGGINGGSGPEQLGWVRTLADSGVEEGKGGNYVVPAGTSVVITDADWQWTITAPPMPEPPPRYACLWHRRTDVDQSRRAR